MKRFIRFVLPLFFSGFILLGCNSINFFGVNTDHPEKSEPKVPVKVNLKAHLGKPTVVMISIDGFSASYLQKFNPPNLLAMAKSGVVSKGLIPSFPTLTFPNHITLVTGRYPGNHGIVGNTFYDKKRDEFYEIGKDSSTYDGSWYKSEPLWAAAENAGILSATYFWVGSEAKIGGVNPTYMEKYDGTVTNSKRVDKVIEWLGMPEETRPHFITLYFSEVDDMGHRYGPNAPETEKAVLGIDSEIGRLKIEAAKKLKDVQFIVVSDHGMVEIKETIDLSSAKNLMEMKCSGRGAMVYFYAKDPQQVEAGYAELLEIQKKYLGKFSFYRASELKPEWHLNDVDRRGDLIVVGEPGVYVGLTRDPQKPFGTSGKGTHGWDAANTPDLNGLFIAAGSLIKSGKVLEPFANVNVYPLVINLLGIISVAQTDADYGYLFPILEK